MLDTKATASLFVDIDALIGEPEEHCRRTSAANCHRDQLAITLSLIGER